MCNLKQFFFFFCPGIVSAYLPLQGGCIPYFLVLLTFFLIKPGDISVRTGSLVKQQCNPERAKAGIVRDPQLFSAQFSTPSPKGLAFALLVQGGTLLHAAGKTGKAGERQRNASQPLFKVNFQNMPQDYFCFHNSPYTSWSLLTTLNDEKQSLLHGTVPTNDSKIRIVFITCQALFWCNKKPNGPAMDIIQATLQS